MSRRWLKLTVAAPLMAFGAVAVDQVGPTWRWPGRSMLTGLLANALGWTWDNRDAHQQLQDRLISGAALIQPGDLLTDVQNVKTQKIVGWTTRGRPEERGSGKFDFPHRRYRDFLAGAELIAVLTLSHSEAFPDLNTLRDALVRPARPLFFGRKPCLPSRPIAAGDTSDFLYAEDVHAALTQVSSDKAARGFWPENEGPDGVRAHEVADMRNWHSGLHGGARTVWEGPLGAESS